MIYNDVFPAEIQKNKAKITWVVMTQIFSLFRWEHLIELSHNFSTLNIMKHISKLKWTGCLVTLSYGSLFFLLHQNF